MQTTGTAAAAGETGYHAANSIAMLNDERLFMFYSSGVEVHRRWNIRREQHAVHVVIVGETRKSNHDTNRLGSARFETRECGC
jgi:hypothetical protein